MVTEIVNGLVVVRAIGESSQLDGGDATPGPLGNSLIRHGGLATARSESEPSTARLTAGRGGLDKRDKSTFSRRGIFVF